MKGTDCLGLCSQKFILCSEQQLIMYNIQILLKQNVLDCSINVETQKMQENSIVVHISPGLTTVFLDRIGASERWHTVLKCKICASGHIFYQSTHFII